MRLDANCAFRLVMYSVVLAVSASAFAESTIAQAVPEGMSASEWRGIRAAYEAHRHAAFAVNGGYVARNPGQQWRTAFDARGFKATPDAGGWTWGLELVSYGRGDSRIAVSSPRCTDAQGVRIEYQWDDNLTEWYINDPRGLEHGYTILERHEGDGAPLNFRLAVRGDLRPKISADGRSVSFVSAAGASVVNYSNLAVFDATGRRIHAWFEFPPAACSVKPDAISIIIDDSQATYPLTIDPIAQQAYLKASNTGAGDQFGISVATSGDTVVVGAPQEASNATGVNGNQANNSASGSGAAYVFIRNAGVWTQQAYLKASNTGAGDGFGFSVALSGDTLAVGASGEDSNAIGVNGNQADNSASGSGAAYVFIRSGGVWSQQAYLKSSNTGAGDQFGNSVALSGDTVVVGAHSEDSNATGVNGNQADNSANESGAAYVFERSGGTWTQQAYLKASNTEGGFPGDSFGSSVAISGDLIVVGAPVEDSAAIGIDGNQADNSANFAGAAYVFGRSGGVWSQQAYLKASNTGATDFFARNVAISNNTLLVGAIGEDSSATGINGDGADNGAADSGAAYVFVRNGGVWSQEAYLKASNTDAGDDFGFSLAVSTDTVVVGARAEDSSAMGVDGNQSDNSVVNSGAAYVFVRSGGTWSQQAYLKASNTEGSDLFGASVAISGDTVLVAAYQEDSGAIGVNGNQADNSTSNSGAAYVFTGVGCPFVGNMNCDCAVDLGDVEPFAHALVDPAGYSSTYLGCDILRGDMLPDAIIDGADISGFVNLLLGP